MIGLWNVKTASFLDIIDTGKEKKLEDEEEILVSPAVMKPCLSL